MLGGAGQDERGAESSTKDTPAVHIDGLSGEEVALDDELHREEYLLRLPYPA